MLNWYKKYAEIESRYFYIKTKTDFSFEKINCTSKYCSVKKFFLAHYRIWGNMASKVNSYPILYIEDLTITYLSSTDIIHYIHTLHDITLYYFNYIKHV